MEIQGTVKQILPVQSGSSKNGQWKKQDFILETEAQYPKLVCINMWGDKIDEFSLVVGEKVKVFINLESREYNGRWYTDVKAWKVEKQGDADGNQTAGAQSQAEDMTGMSFSEEEGDLPF